MFLFCADLLYTLSKEHYTAFHKALALLVHRTQAQRQQCELFRDQVRRKGASTRPEGESEEGVLSVVEEG